jgi:membrane-bound lytic murein transglycosylase A
MAKTPIKLSLIFYVFFTLILTGCGTSSPLLPLPTPGYPSLSDDLDYTDLDQAIEQSLIYLRKRPQSSHVTIANQSRPVEHLIRSLTFFRSLISSHPSANLLQLELETYFDLYQAAGTDGYNPGHKMLVTGYYQPVFDGRLTRQGAYVYPIYAIPNTLALRRDTQSGTYKIGRLNGGSFLNYWTRSEIENRGHAQGNELVYLKNPMDAFLLHIQGSGLIRLADGSTKGIHYALKNGRQYKSIGKYMVETGKMELSEASIDTIRKYITANPAEQEEILHHNDSYIFFEWTTTHGAIGNLGRELTAGRSIAVDQKHFPAGGLAFLSSRKPVIKDNRIINWFPLNRFVLAQDTGSAIQGSGRVDLFWGSGPTAGLAAGSMKEDGTLYFLFLKKQFL